MALHLVTGYKGTPHITAPQQGAFNAGIVGEGEYVLSNGNKLAAVVTSSNSIKILDGDLVMQGRHVTIDKDTFEEVAINNGEVDKNRNDLIVARYTKDATSGIENVVLAVIQGTSTTDTATDPEYTTGDLLSGDCLLHEMPLYRIPLTGLTVGEPIAVFEVVNTLEDVKGLLYKGVVPFSSSDEDTPENWGAFGSGVWEINNTSVIKGSYDRKGTIINTVIKDSSGRFEVTQILLCNNISPGIYTRTGSYSRTYGGYTWTPSSSTGWNNFLTGSHPKTPIIAGTYWGTGTGDEDNPSYIACPFQPVFFMIRRSTDTMFGILPDMYNYYPVPSGYDATQGVAHHNLARTYDFNAENFADKDVKNYATAESNNYMYAVEWFSEDYGSEYAANYQSNISGEEYHYMVVGREHW